MKRFLLSLVSLGIFISSPVMGQGILLKGKLKLNNKDELHKLKGIKLYTDFREGSLWLYFDVAEGNVQKWLINSEPWGSIRLEHDAEMNYYGRAEMGQNFVEIESWMDTVSQEENWVIKSVNDVFFLRKKPEETKPGYSLLRQIITDKGRAEIPLIEYSYDTDSPKVLTIKDEAPLSDYPLLMKVISAWLATMESLGELKVLENHK